MVTPVVVVSSVTATLVTGFAADGASVPGEAGAGAGAGGCAGTDESGDGHRTDTGTSTASRRGKCGAMAVSLLQGGPVFLFGCNPGDFAGWLQGLAGKRHHGFCWWLIFSLGGGEQITVASGPD